MTKEKMNDKEIFAFFFLLIIASVSAVQTLYRDMNGGFGKQLTGFTRENPFVDAKQMSNMLDNFKYFNKHPEVIDIHFNGVITFNRGLTNIFKGACQQAPKGQNDFLAVYWAMYDSGTVHMLEHNKNGKQTINPGMIDRLLIDLNEGFGEKAVQFNNKNNNPITERTITYINKVIVFTWYNMYLEASTQGAAKRRRHVFQAVLANVDGDRWFIQTYYASIQSDGNWDHTGSRLNQKCEQAQFGVSISGNKAGSTFRTPYSLPSVLECLTNQHPFRDLGSWVFDINLDAMKQPNPPDLVCTADSRRDQKCVLKEMAAEVKKMEQQGILFGGNIADLTDPETQRFADRYCEFRDAGLHKLPILCDVFIVCSLGKGASVKICPPGQSYNPDIQTCDFAENFECFFQDVNITDFTGVIAKSIHGNICHYRGFGNIADPNNCNTYYACTNARSIQMPCPDNLFYEPSTDECLRPSQVQCTGNGDRSGAKR